MRWIMGSSIRLGRLVVAAAVAVLVLGVLVLGSAKVDVYPEFTPPTVEVQTEALGLSAAEVESLVTVPLEQDLLNGVPWLSHISSNSVPGLSQIDLVFQPGTDIYSARQMVQERMTQIRVLPNVGTPPIMIQPLASSSRVAMIGLSTADATKLPLVDLSVLARWKIRPRLMGVPGVANVAIYGQRDRQLQVQVNPARLAAAHVALQDVVKTAGNALWVSPLTFLEANTPGTGGYIESPNQRLGIQHILPVTSPESLAKIPLTQGDKPTKLPLSAVADVRVDHQPLIGDAVVKGAPSLVLVVEKFPGADTEQVTRGVEDAMASMQPGLRGVVVDQQLYRPATYVETAVHNLGVAGLVALGLLVVLVALFLYSWRYALIAIVVVPLSLVGAAWILELRDTTFTTMTLVGLAAAVGVLVDDVVVDVCSLRRRLRERRARGEEIETSSAVAEALLQARGSLVYATLIVLLVTVPAYVLSPLVSSFSRPAVVSFALALLVSFVVALVVTPTLAVLLLGTARGEDRAGPLARWAQRTFDRGTSAVLDRPRRAVFAAAVLAVGAIAVVPQLGSGSLLPSLRDPNLLVHVRSVAGTSLVEMDRITTAMSQELRALPGVRDVGSHVGRAVTSDSISDVNSGEVWVSMDPSGDLPRTQDAVRRVVAGYPGLRTDVESYASDRLASTERGLGSDLVVRVFGNGLQQLHTTADQVRAAIAGVDGVAATSVEPLVQQPAAEVRVKPAAAALYGLTPGDIRRAATTMMSGLLVGNLYEQQAVFDVLVIGPQVSRNSLSSLQEIMIDSPKGLVPLSTVAKVTIAPEATSIRHEGVSRAVDVAITVRGRDAGSVAADIDARVAAVPMPEEFHAEVIRSDDWTAGGGVGFAGYVLAAAVGIYLLLQVATRSWRLATLLFVVLPLACVGGVLVAPVVGGVGSVGALAGLVAVLAVAVRQGLVLVRRYQAVEEDRGWADARGLVATETSAAVAPVILTALTTAGVFLPVAILGGSAGLEVLRPLAVVVLGGLVTTVIVVLLVLPGLYLGLSHRRRPHIDLPTQHRPAEAAAAGHGRDLTEPELR